MDKKIASELMLAIEQINVALGVTAAAIEMIPDMEERKEFRKGVADLMGSVYGDMMVPILRQYPELDPDLPKTNQ